MRPVAITGIGLVSPLGMGVETHLSALRSAAGGIRAPADPELAALGVAGVGAVPVAADPDGGRTVRLALLAVSEALSMAGVQPGGLPEDCRLCFSTSKGEIVDLCGAISGGGSSGQPLYGRFSPDCAGLAVARQLGLKGSVVCRAAACATGLVSVLAAAREVASGRCSMAIAGAAEASLSAFVHAGFASMGVLARGGPSENPASLVRPFDADRRGFLLGEGAGAAVIESPENARVRGARILALLAGGGQSSDAFGQTAPDPEGRGVETAARQAVRMAGIEPDDLGGVWAHGTGTKDGDAAEAAGLARALAGSRRPIPVSASKGLTGHLLGASGATEFAMAVACLREGWLPGVANLLRSDCQRSPLAMSAQGGRPDGRPRCLVLSAGFGGHVAAALLENVEGRYAPDGCARRTPG